MTLGDRKQSLYQKFNNYGQAHVFAHYDSLNESEKDLFLDELNKVDLEWVEQRVKQYTASKNNIAVEQELLPAPVVALPKNEIDNARVEVAVLEGEEALRLGKVAAFLVAGGQGTRLGFDGPKGCYPLGIKSGKTLFQIHAEQILARAKKYQTVIPWYIMTSNINDKATKSFFADNNFFGFAESDVIFFTQEMVPAVDFAGKLILEKPNDLAMNPNGHGGSFVALNSSGALADMKKRGIEVISYFQVDNPLVTICDPIFVGYHLLAEAGMSSKVLKKNNPEEKVGVVCLIDGKTTVIEYSDLSEKDMYAKDKDGELKFWAGSIAIHMLSVDFAESIVKKGLPWHIVTKKIPYLDENKNLVIPTENNGIKFETFVFDALPETEHSITMEVEREREFAPVKNKTGVDSVDSARMLLSNYAMQMLKNAGVKVPIDAEGNAKFAIEISSLYALDSMELKNKIDVGFEVSEDLVLDIIN